MFDFKNPIYSKTVIAASIGLVAALAGLDLDKLEAGQIADQLTTIITAVSLIAAIYGRIVAKDKLSLKAGRPK